MMNAREFYNAIASAEISEELKDYAIAQIEKMDASNAKSRAKNAEKRVDNTPFVEAVVNLIGSEPMTGEQLVQKLAEAGVTEINGKAVTRNKVASLLRGPVAEGTVVKTQVKGEKGKIVAYVIA